MVNTLGLLLWVLLGGEWPTSNALPVLGQAECRVVVFLSPECPISKSQTPELRALEKSFPDVPFAYFFPVQNTTEAQARAFCAQYGLTGSVQAGSVAFDEARALEATTLPECFVLDTRGAILYSGRIENSHARPGKRKAMAGERDLYNALSALQNSRKPPVAQTPAVGCKITFPHIP
ncbi:hypothetical protein GC167_00895 [bacterium]|nr:hypothetical protein [bacterium]